MRVLNPNKGTVHLRDHLSNTFVNLKPGINELSESQVATFGNQFASAGLELVLEMFDTPEPQAEPLQEAAPELEPLNEKEPQAEPEAVAEEVAPGVVHTEEASKEPKKRGGRPKKVEE